MLEPIAAGGYGSSCAMQARPYIWTMAQIFQATMTSKLKSDGSGAVDSIDIEVLANHRASYLDQVLHFHF